MTKDEELIERLANARRIVRDECGDIPQYVRTCIEAALADATDRLEALARPVVGVEGREDIERDIRIAIWNAGMNGGMGQDLSQAFIVRAMVEPTMIRALAALAASPSPVVGDREAREALEQILLIVEEEPYKVSVGQKPCKHTAALNEIHEIADATLSTHVSAAPDPHTTDRAGMAQEVE